MPTVDPLEAEYAQFRRNNDSTEPAVATVDPLEAEYAQFRRQDSLLEAHLGAPSADPLELEYEQFKKSDTPETDKVIEEQSGLPNVAALKAGKVEFAQGETGEKFYETGIPNDVAQTVFRAPFDLTGVTAVGELAGIVAPKNPVTQVQKGVMEIGGDLVASMTSPMNLSLLAAGGALGKLGTVLLSAGFEAHALKHAPEQYEQFREALAKEDYQSATRIGGNLVVGLGLPAAAVAIHGAQPPKPKEGVKTGQTEEPATLPRPPQENPVAENLGPETAIVETPVNPELGKPVPKVGETPVESGLEPVGVTETLTELQRRNAPDDPFAQYRVEPEGVRNPVSTEPLPPVETGRAPGVSKIGQSIEAKAVEAKLTQGFSETAGFDPITIQDQAQRATGLIKSSVEDARAVIRGEAPLPEGLRGTALITAMEEHLLQKPDAKLAYELANSPLTSATSVAAQEMRLMAERVPDSITAKFQEIREARRAGSELRGETPLKVAKEIQTEVVRQSSKRQTWEQFVKEIAC